MHPAGPPLPALAHSTPVEDGALLRRWVEARDEQAFGECVRRHVDLVYSAALRRLNGDAHGAADITQQVFAALARAAAGLGPDVVLPAWLYVTTRHLSANFVRAEASRRAREQEAHRMNELNASPAPAEWEQLRPLLDAVIDELGEADRRAVVLRFFARRPLAEIGASLHVSEDAARMRVDRALDKLRLALSRRGIVSTGTALSALLAHHAVVAAPTGLSALATGAALSGGAGAATAGTFTFMALTKSQVAVGVAVLGGFLAGVAVTKYTARSAHSDTPVAASGAAGPHAAGEATRRTTSARSAPPGAAAARPGSGSAGSAAARRVSRGQLQAETAAALNTPSSPDKFLALLAIFQRLTPENWREVLTAFADERKRTGLAHSEAFGLFVRRAGEVVGREAVAFFLKSDNPAVANEAMMGWATKSPVEALQWLGHEAGPAARAALLGGVIRGLALSEPDLAIQTLEQVPVKERSQYTEEFVTSMLRSAGIDQTQKLVEGMIGRATAAGTADESYLRHVFFDYTLLRISQAAASGTLPEAFTWLNQHAGQPYEGPKIITAAAQELTARAPAETFRWLERVNTALLQAGSDTLGYRVYLGKLANQDGPASVETWLQAQTAHPHYDQLAYQWVALVAAQQPQTATTWASSIKNEKLRQDAQQLIAAKAAKKQ